MAGPLSDSPLLDLARERRAEVNFGVAGPLDGHEAHALRMALDCMVYCWAGVRGADDHVRRLKAVGKGAEDAEFQAAVADGQFLILAWERAKGAALLLDQAMRLRVQN